MNMKKLLGKQVKKLTVKDLKNALKDADDESEVVLGFYMKDEGLHYVYLADVFTHMTYDSVLKEKLYDSRVCELSGFNHKDCIYEGEEIWVLMIMVGLV